MKLGLDTSIYIDMSRFTNLSWPQTNSFWKLLLLYVDPQTVKYSQAFSCQCRNWCTFPIIKLRTWTISDTNHRCQYLCIYIYELYISIYDLWYINPQGTPLKHHPSWLFGFQAPHLMPLPAPDVSQRNRLVVELGWVQRTMWFFTSKHLNQHEVWTICDHTKQWVQTEHI